MTQNYFGFKKPSNKIVVAATDSCFFSEYKLESATNAYAGRLAMMGTNEDDIVVADGVTYMPHGFIGYEQSFLGSTSVTSNRPSTVDTIWTVSMRVPVLKGGGFWIVGAVPIGVDIKKGDLLAPWTGGTLVPVAPMNGGYAIRVPFSKNATEKDTGLDLPAGMTVRDVIAKVVTAASGASIDVGIGIGTESGFDTDGFLDGESCATAGFVVHVNGNTTEANNTLGALIATGIKSGDSTPLYLDVPKAYVGNGTCKSLCYTTSDHTVAGYLYFVVEGAGFAPVAVAEQNLAATTAVTDLMVKSLI